jgi:general secretion pathway protein D
MKKINTVITLSFFICLLSTLTNTNLYSQNILKQDTESESAEQSQDATTADTSDEEEVADIIFNYENEDISNIINKLAALKNLNVIFPPGDVFNNPPTKVSLHIDQKLTIDQAWELLNTLLDVTGFFIVPQGSMIRIIKTGKEMSREPMTTYIGVHPDDLPNSEQPIRYLCYLANIRVSDQPENELNGIIKDILPENVLAKADASTNSLLLVAKANDIRGVMKIILELDRIDFQEKMDIIPLLHTSAVYVAELINQQLVKPENANPYRLDTKKAKEIPYFSGFTKIIPEPRLNKLIILGRPQAVERLKDFIKKYIDVAPDSGQSILHVYHLQYLNAREFAPVLERIVQEGGGGEGGPSQASSGEQKGKGTERFFDKVIVHTDSPTNQEVDNVNTPVRQQRPTFYGGNNLVIAARSDDWKQIKKLIEELDTPQRQVLIEVLVADLTAEDARLLGSMTRIPEKVPFPDQIGFQSAMLGQVIPSDLSATPPTPATATIEADLLKNAYMSGQTLANPASAGTNNLADFALSGTTILSLNDNDGRTWSIWELLQLFRNSKILSHPHVIARNNKEAKVSIGQTRWLKDKVKDIAGNYFGGATTIKFKPISATLKVNIIPRVSSANTVNLQVLIDINDWQDNPNNVKNLRLLETNANIKSGGIFALGGLIRTTTATSEVEVPILGKIPILGWFFKRKSKNLTKNNLTVFISPTIIEPRLRAGIGEYTQDYIDVTKDYSRGDLFDSLKDPITRWFFRDDIDTPKSLDDFAARDENLMARKNTLKDKELNKARNAEFQTIDSSDSIAEKTGITISSHELVPQLHKEVPDLKAIMRDDPNPFLKT